MTITRKSQITQKATAVAYSLTHESMTTEEAVRERNSLNMNRAEYAHYCSVLTYCIRMEY
jgi:hypothetical protein